MKIYAATRQLDREGLKNAIIYLFSHVAKQRGFRKDRLRIHRISIDIYSRTVKIQFKFMGYNGEFRTKLPYINPIPEDYFVSEYADSLSQILISPSDLQQRSLYGFEQFKKMINSIADKFDILSFDFPAPELSEFNIVGGYDIWYTAQLSKINTPGVTWEHVNPANSHNDYTWYVRDAQSGHALEYEFNTHNKLNDLYNLTTGEFDRGPEWQTKHMHTLIDEINKVTKNLSRLDKYIAILDEIQNRVAQEYPDAIITFDSHPADTYTYIITIPTMRYDLQYNDDGYTVDLRTGIFVNDVFKLNIDDFLGIIGAAIHDYKNEKEESEMLFEDFDPVIYEDYTTDGEEE